MLVNFLLRYSSLCVSVSTKYSIIQHVRTLMIRTLTPGSAVVEAELSSRGLPLQCSPHKSAAVMGLPGRRLFQHEISMHRHDHMLGIHTQQLCGLHKHADLTKAQLPLWCSGCPDLASFPLPLFYGLNWHNTRKQKNGEKQEVWSLDYSGGARDECSRAFPVFHHSSATVNANL